MSEADRQRWDNRYAAKRVPPAPAPPAWLVEHLGGLRPGRALDLATGMGHCAVELARRGWHVTAVDISGQALLRARTLADRMGVHVDWIQADLETYPLPASRFDLVCVFYYLDRHRLPARIVRALKPGGILIYETFTSDQLRMPNAQVSNPEHYLQPGELLSLFAAMRVRHYRDVILPERAVASLVAEK